MSTASLNSCPQLPISLLLKVCLRPNPPKIVFYALVEACQDAWDEQSESGTTSLALSGIVYSDLLRAAVQLEEFEIFKEVAKKRSMKDTAPVAFFTWLREWVGYDDNEAALRFKRIRVGLRYCLPSCFDDLFAAIEAFVPLEGSGSSCPTIAQFAQSELCSRAQQAEPSHLSKSDGRALVKSARYFGNTGFFISEDMLIISGSVVKILSLCYDDPEVIFGFVFQIQQDGIKGIPQEEAALISHSVAADLLKNAKPGEWRPRPVIESLFTKGSPEERSAVKSEDIAEFLSIFLEANPEDDGLVWEFLSSLIQTLPDLNLRQLTSLWIPFLSALTNILASNSIPFTDPVYQKLYLTFITKLVDNFVGHEPPEISGNVRATKSAHKNTKARKQWYERRVEAVALLKTFDQSHLKSLLGSKYDKLFRMQHLTVAKPPPLQRPLKHLAGAANQTSAGPRRGAKRKAKQMN
ncbi:unnamed protein product [Clonostachys solani]|uniref:Uncharacterized protein n=1 Tax=Clonostachys solani TaxID=160281 RepID=A0A9N9Z9V0_9HYPO|nr:unnamed protein product [Clonostachys solani]